MFNRKIILTLVLISYITTPNTVYAGKWINWGTIIEDVSSCIIEIVDSIKTAIGGEKISVTGTKVIQTKKITISGIDAITVSGSALLVVTQDDAQAEELMIEADEAIMPYIDIHLQNNELTIGIKKNISLYTIAPNVYRINAKNLLRINVSGATNVQLKDIKTQSLSINIQGSSKINGSLFVNQLNINASGASNILLNGNALEQNITIHGSSTFDGRHLSGKHMIIQGYGATRIYSNVSDKIDGTLSGSGSFMYLNSPIVNVEKTKAVSLEKANF